MSEPKLLEPGVYEGLSFADYCAIDAVNNSRLGQMAKSPRHYLSPFREPTRTLLVGNLIHTGRLEPTALAERYAVAPDWHKDEANVTGKGEPSESKNTKYVQAKAAEFADANREREIVTRDEYASMMSVVEAIDRDPLARRLFNDIGPVEVTIVWDDPETGIRCKGRIDKVGVGYHADLKSTLDVLDFPRSIGKYHYHRQAAFYRYGWSVLNGGELPDCYLVAAEKGDPFCVQAAPLSEASLDQGDRIWRWLLNRVAECHKSGEWPGPEAPDMWEAPTWAIPDGLPRYVETETELVAV